METMMDAHHDQPGTRGRLADQLPALSSRAADACTQAQISEEHGTPLARLVLVSRPVVAKRLCNTIHHATTWDPPPGGGGPLTRCAASPGPRQCLISPYVDLEHRVPVLSFPARFSETCRGSVLPPVVGLTMIGIGARPVWDPLPWMPSLDQQGTREGQAQT